MCEQYIDIKYKLEAKGKNISWLANELGVSIPYTIDLLKGRRNTAKRLEDIIEILKGIGIKWNY